MPNPGRPRVLDDFKRGQIAALVATGYGLAAAARHVGCAVDTIRREAKRNDNFRRELRVPNSVAPALESGGTESLEFCLAKVRECVENRRAERRPDDAKSPNIGTFEVNAVNA